jgi:hypothetical protein
MAAKKHRVLWSRILAVVFAILLPLTAVSAWAITTVTNTDRWVATLHPLATNPTITNYLAQQGSSAIVQNFDVEKRVKEALPSSAAFLAATITTTLQNYIEEALATALHSQEFSRFWDRINRVSHNLAMNVLTGKANGKIDKANSYIVDVTPALVNAIDALNARGITFLNPIKQHISENRIASLQLFSKKQLSKVQKYYNLAVTLRWVMILVTLLLAAGVIAVARPVRQGVRRLFIALAISAGLTYSLIKIAVRIVSNSAQTPSDVTKAILDTITAYLSDELLLLTFIGIGGVVIVWFTGRGEKAVASRVWIANNAKTLSSAVSQKSHEVRDGELAEWSRRHRSQLQTGLVVANIVVIILAGIALFAWISSFWGLITLVLLALAWYWLYQRLAGFLEAQQPSLEAGSSPSDQAGPTPVGAGDAEGGREEAVAISDGTESAGKERP